MSEHAEFRGTAYDTVVIATRHTGRDSVSVVTIEFLDGNREWHVLAGATASQLEPGVYEVTIPGVPAMWTAHAEVLRGMLLRLDGREVIAGNAVRCGDDVIVLRAFGEKSAPRI